MNPNKTWTYGQWVSNPTGPPTFQKLSYLGNASYGYNGTALIYKPSNVPGITPGQVDLDAIDETPDVRWTTPFRMVATITAVVGNSTGNTFAAISALDLNGMAQAGTYNPTANTESWTLTDVSLFKGEILDVYVPDPFGGVHPDTQAQIHITFVSPEPAPFAVLGLGALGLVLRRRRRS